MRIPEDAPKPGFYYHYQHNPFGPVNSCAYEVLGIAFNTEAEGSAEVIYRALYCNAGEELSRTAWWSRPLYMWNETIVTKGWPTRFTRIENPSVIAELTKIRDEMYPPA